MISGGMTVISYLDTLKMGIEHLLRISLGSVYKFKEEENMMDLKQT